MFYIVWALLLFVASMAVHICYCRKTTKSGLQAKAFILTAFIFFGIYFVSVIALQYLNLLDPYSLWGLPFRITAGIIFILLIPIYLIFYVLTQLTSPSKKILLAISQRGSLSHRDIVACVQEENFITTRLKDLCTSGCVKQVDDRYILSGQGQKIAAFLNLMQLVLGRKVGG